MNDSIDPNDPRFRLTCDGMPTVEQAEESKRQLREQNPLWFFEDTFYENELMWREACEWSKREMMRTQPELARLLWPDLFK
jgi:hypothetical protein